MDNPAKSGASPFIILLPWLTVLAWAGLIFYLSAQPHLSTNLGIGDFILRKLAHIAEFGILCLLLWTALRRHIKACRPALFLSALIAVAYAASDEYHQAFVPGRRGAAVDVVVYDLAGIVLMAGFILAVRSYKRRRLLEREAVRTD